MPDRVLYFMDFERYQPLASQCLTRLKDAAYRDIVLLHVMNETRSLRGVPDLLRADVARCVREAVQRRMDEVTREFDREGMTVRPLLAKADNEWIELCDIARREEVSLVVLGPRVGPDPGPTTYFVMHAVATHLLILKIAPPAGEVPYRDSCKGVFARVLLPTDWSDCARRAERYVVSLKGAGIREVILAHVKEPGLTEAQREEYATHARKRLAHSSRALGEAGLEVRSLLLEGDPCHTIVDAADRENASLIVMGSTGKSVTEERLVGSISERVALVSRASVLLVH